MDDEIILGLAGLGVVALIALWLVGVVPIWMVIQGNWAAFPWWFNISIQISRVFAGLICPLYLLVTLTGKIGYFTKGINAGILSIWGYPVYRKAVMDLAFTELAGLPLQRSILKVIIILALEISIISYGGSNNDHD